MNSFFYGWFSIDTYETLIGKSLKQISGSILFRSSVFKTLMVGHGGCSVGSYIADPTSPIPSHCASIAVTSTLRVNYVELLSHYWQFIPRIFLPYPGVQSHVWSINLSYFTFCMLYVMMRWDWDVGLHRICIFHLGCMDVTFPLCSVVISSYSVIHVRSIIHGYVFLLVFSFCLLLLTLKVLVTTIDALRHF